MPLAVVAAGGTGGHLFPAEARARGNIDRWMDCQQTQLNRPQSVVFITMVRTPPEQRDPAALAQALGEAGRAWALLETPLSRHPFIAGDTLSLADIAWGVHVHRWFAMEIARPPAPHTGRRPPRAGARPSR